MKKKLYILLLLIIFIFNLNACQSVWQRPLPSGNIIYQAEETEKFTHYRLGFVDSDGENNTIVMPGRQFSKPVWSSDGKFIYGFSDGESAYSGYPAYWDLNNGNFGVCSKNLPSFDEIQGGGNPDNPYDVIVQHVWVIIDMDLSNCSIIRSLVNYESEPGDYQINGFTYSPQNQILIYGLILNPYESPKYELRYLDLNTGKEKKLAEGINPALSPDGTKVAYIGFDGLYVGGISDGRLSSQRLVNRQFFEPVAYHGPSEMTPSPAWSPDGQWVIYHRCDTAKICDWENTTIYKVNINVGLEVLIVTGGKFPSWKP